MMTMSRPVLLKDPSIFPFYALCLIYFLFLQPPYLQFSETSVLLKIAPIVFLLVYVQGRGDVGDSKQSSKKSNQRSKNQDASLTGNSSSSSSSDSRQAYKNFFSLGLAFSIVGDVFVAWRSTFNYGVVAFAVAHVAYISGFRARGTASARYAWYTYTFAVLTFVMVLTSKIDSPSLMALICTYNVLVFSTFVFGLACHEHSNNKYKGTAAHNNDRTVFYGLLGGASFAASDLLIGLDLWVLDYVPYPQAFIMITYYMAQFFLALSVF